jgi:HPt (histidine-containing phosphotransfer) domain-containing protein
MPDRDSRITLQVPSDLNDIFPEFLESRRKEIATIPDTLARGDYQQIRIWGHNMAGCGEGYGFPALSEVGRQLEAAALARDVNAITHCEHTLSHLVNNVYIVYC